MGSDTKALRVAGVPPWENGTELISPNYQAERAERVMLLKKKQIQNKRWPRDQSYVRASFFCRGIHLLYEI